MSKTNSPLGKEDVRRQAQRLRESAEWDPRRDMEARTPRRLIARIAAKRKPPWKTRPRCASNTSWQPWVWSSGHAMVRRMGSCGSIVSKRLLRAQSRMPSHCQ